MAPEPFHGIIQMYFRDLSRKQFSLVKKWGELHRKELEENWRRARNRETLAPIEPWR